jgi:hypothetical protein
LIFPLNSSSSFKQADGKIIKQWQRRGCNGGDINKERDRDRSPKQRRGGGKNVIDREKGERPSFKNVNQKSELIYIIGNDLSITVFITPCVFFSGVDVC